MKDLKNDIQIAHGISATLSGTTAAKGNIIDRQGYESITFAFQTGTVTDAGTTAGFACEIQESDTTADTAFTAVADASLIGLESDLTVTADSYDNKPVGAIGYKGSKRYVRCVWTGTTGTDAVINGVVIKGHPSLAPVGSVATNIAAT